MEMSLRGQTSANGPKPRPSFQFKAGKQKNFHSEKFTLPIHEKDHFIFVNLVLYSTKMVNLKKFIFSSKATAYPRTLD